MMGFRHFFGWKSIFNLEDELFRKIILLSVQSLAMRVPKKRAHQNLFESSIEIQKEN